METAQNSPEAIAVISASIKRDTAGRWVNTDLTEEDNARGAPGGKLRVVAAAILAKRYPEAMIIASGGRGYDLPEGTPEDRPALAEILRDELADYGVSPDKVILETASNSTYQQIGELERVIGEKQLKKILLVTNRYHLPRLKAMIDMKFPDLGKHASLELVSAEEVLILEDPHRWAGSIETAYQSEYMLARMANEQRGVEQICSGTYQFR